MNNLLSTTEISNIDFFNQLNNFDNISENICLITNECLEPKHITLECNHTFNYIPFICEVYATRLSSKTIECPYCRTPQHQNIYYNGVLLFVNGRYSKEAFESAKKLAKLQAIEAKKEAKMQAMEAKKEAKMQAMEAKKEAKLQAKMQAKKQV